MDTRLMIQMIKEEKKTGDLKMTKRIKPSDKRSAITLNI